MRIMRMRNKVLLAAWLVLAAAACTLYLCRDAVLERQRANAMELVLAALADGMNGVTVPSDALPVWEETNALDGPLLTEDAKAVLDAAEAKETTGDGDALLRIWGKLEIPVIDCCLPVYDGADAVALRFGAGLARVPDTDISVIFAYHSGTDGRLFSQLSALSAGDGVLLTPYDGMRTAYRVAAVHLLRSESLQKELAFPPEDAAFVLIANHPSGSCAYRMAVWLSPA